MTSHDTLYGNSRLIGQFVLSADRNEAPPGWQTDRIQVWFLSRHPRLPAIQLTDEADMPVGWMLGYPISEEGRLAGDGEALRVPARAMVSDEVLENFVYSFGGRFVAVVLDARLPRFFLDPCGSLSAVYCAHQRLVASTPNLIPYDALTRDRVELAHAIGIPYTEGMYPFTMTSRYGVERILPNHYLDLRDWRTIRHWPKQPLGEVSSVKKAIAEIATIVKRQIAAIVSTTPTYLPLTAGQDSRMLLACARDLAERLEVFTRKADDTLGAIDYGIARKIAKRLGLNYRVLANEKASDEHLDEYMFRISYSTSEFRGWQSATMLKRLPGDHAVLVGCAGEVARGYYWRDEDTETTTMRPERLLQICACPPEDEPLARARAWLDTIPAVNAFQVLDPFFVEQDLGGWAGILQYAECDAGFTIFPLCHRDIVERMLMLPICYRREGRMPRDLVAQEWPLLLEWPVNQAVGFTALRLRLKRATRKGFAIFRPANMLRKLRGGVT